MCGYPVCRHSVIYWRQRVVGIAEKRLKEMTGGMCFTISRPANQDDGHRSILRTGINVCREFLKL